jgi:hypothetical protein
MADVLDAEMRARLRAVFNEVCAGVSCYETELRALVASKLLEAATSGEISAEGLRKIGREALRHARKDDVSAVRTRLD